MRPRRLVQALFLLVIPALMLGQAPDDAAKERQARFTALLEDTIAQIKDLRLPENRAFCFAQAGRLLWDRDQTRATSLFESAGVELAAAIDGAAARQKPGRYYDPNANIQFRQQILTTIADRDAALALDLLYRTRPAAITKAMTPPDPRDTRINNYQNNAQYIAENERSIENNFYRMAAEQDPAKAIAILKVALAKPVSQGTFEQLRSLAEKDPSAAAECARDVVKQLVSANYMRDNQPNYIILSLTNQVLEQYLSATATDPADQNPMNRMRFDPAGMRDLANKMISTYLSNANTRGYMSPSSLMRYAEKFAPGYVEQLKAFTTPQVTGPPSATDAEYARLMAAEIPADQMVSGAGKLPANLRSQIYSNASEKLLNQGNSMAARAVIEQNFTDEARDQALLNFDQQYIYRLLNESKFADAEIVINGLPEANRIEMLVQLAGRAYGAGNDKNRAYALNVLENARSLISDRPTDTEEMNRLMQVAGAFAQIDVSRALDIVERVVPQVNELSEAAAVLWSYQDHNGVREGEFVIANGGGFNQFGINAYMFGQLANADLDRTTIMIDGFSHPEIRVALRLQMLANGPQAPRSRAIILRGVSNLPIQGRRVTILN